MPSTYIPRRDGDLDNWLANFAELIAGSPDAYGLTQSDADAVSAAVDAWHAAYLTAVAPISRTKTAVLAKDEQRKAVLKVVRPMAARVRVNAAVSNELKIGLGLHVRSAGEGKQSGAGSAIPPPHTAPNVMSMGMDVGRQFLRIADMVHTTRKGKPPGTVGALLFRIVGDGPALRPDGAELIGLVTNNKHTAEFAHADHGKTATYFARWVGPKGEQGPWSAPRSVPIAA